MERPCPTPMALTDKNLYVYCDNNPVVRVDHDGQFWETVFDVIPELKGVRPDYIDFDNNIFYEWKPMNPRGVRSGIRQLQRYNKAFGGGFTLRLELY